MYHYIYDNYLIERKYQSTLARIESRLTDLGINGKITRLSTLKNISREINNNITKEVKTIVIIGNDQTLNQVINIIGGNDVIFGFIPLGPDNKIAKIIGIPEGESACNILSSRIIKQIHLGLINGKYHFITHLEMPGDNVYLNCDDNYYINIEDKKDIITISNIYLNDNESEEEVINSQNYLNLIIKHTNKGLFKNKKETYSYFKASKISINSEKSVPIFLADEKRIIKTPIQIETSKEKINLIVGKKRIIS